MKKVVSIALFGAGDKYAQYLRAFVRGHLNLFSIADGWELRVHIDDTVAGEYGHYHFDENGESRPLRFLNRLVEANLITLRRMGSAALTRAMLWRAAPVFDEGVEAVFCRDLDAPPMPRDRACCDAFLRSDCVVHTVHDNVAHCGIMGGLCGFRAAEFRAATGFQTLEQLCDAANQTDAEWAQHGMDQVALNRLLIRAGGPKLFEHRFAGWTAGAPGPGRRRPGSYACGGASALVPDTGVSHLKPEDAVTADRLGNHLGCAGYDHEAAREFWDRKGDFEVAARVHACEKGLW